MTRNAETVLWDVERWCLNTLQGGTYNGQVAQMVEELGELTTARKQGDHDAMADELGDVGVVWISLCALLGYDPINVLEAAYDKIKDRKGEMRGGRFVKEADLDG